MLREIEKCDVRCANCHRRRTAGQFNWSKKSGITIDAADGPRPGTTGRYRVVKIPQQSLLFTASANGLRRCSRCGQAKPVYDFAFRDRSTGERDYYCRPCRRAYRRAHYERNTADYVARAMNEMRMKREDRLVQVFEYLRTHPCVDCGETDIAVLEFDHIDPGTKVKEIGLMIGRRSWTTIATEIAKCEVCCANCHRRRTARQQGWKARMAEERPRYGRIVA